MLNRIMKCGLNDEESTRTEYQRLNDASSNTKATQRTWGEFFHHITTKLGITESEQNRFERIQRQYDQLPAEQKNQLIQGIGLAYVIHESIAEGGLG